MLVEGCTKAPERFVGLESRCVLCILTNRSQFVESVSCEDSVQQVASNSAPVTWCQLGKHQWRGRAEGEPICSVGAR